MKYPIRTYYEIDKSGNNSSGTGYPMQKFHVGKIISNYLYQTKKQVYEY